MNDVTPPSDEKLDNLAKAAAGLSMLTIIADNVVGYRRKLIEGGVGEEAADNMAQEYHATLMNVVEKQMLGATAAFTAAASRSSAPKRRRG